MLRMTRQLLPGIALLCLIGSAVAAGPVDPLAVKWSGDLEAAIATAKESKKLVMIEFTADWCHYCHKMEKETLSDKKVAAEINGCYVAVRLDADKHAALLNKLGISGLPSTVLLDPESKRADRVVGFRTTDQFLKDLQKFCPADRKVAVQAAVGRARVE